MKSQTRDMATPVPLSSVSQTLNKAQAKRHGARDVEMGPEKEQTSRDFLATSNKCIATSNNRIWPYTKRNDTVPTEGSTKLLQKIGSQHLRSKSTKQKHSGILSIIWLPSQNPLDYWDG